MASLLNRCSVLVLVYAGVVLGVLLCLSFRVIAGVLLVTFALTLGCVLGCVR